jgi:hypothetical protein
MAEHTKGPGNPDAFGGAAQKAVFPQPRIESTPHLLGAPSPLRQCTIPFASMHTFDAVRLCGLRSWPAYQTWPACSQRWPSVTTSSTKQVGVPRDSSPPPAVTAPRNLGRAARSSPLPTHYPTTSVMSWPKSATPLCTSFPNSSFTWTAPISRLWIGYSQTTPSLSCCRRATSYTG